MDRALRFVPRSTSMHVHALVIQSHNDRFPGPRWRLIGKPGKQYWGRSQPKTGGGQRTEYLHILVATELFGPLPRGVQVDHKDGDRLNNAPDNLRLATPTENARNRKRHGNNTSGQPGVSWCNRRKMWWARVTVNYEQRMLGYFASAEEAGAVVRAAKAELFGDFDRGV